MVAGSEKLSGYADGANRFHDDVCSPCLSTISLSLFFSFFIHRFSFLFFLKSTCIHSHLSIPLVYSLSLSDVWARDLGHSYAHRNRIFFVAPRPKIPVFVHPWVKRRGNDRSGIGATKTERRTATYRRDAAREKGWGFRYFEIIGDCLLFGIVPIVSSTPDIETASSSYCTLPISRIIDANRSIFKWHPIIRKLGATNIIRGNLK